MPVLIRGDGAHRFGVKHKMGPIEIHFFKPMFLDRSWLLPPEEGGKSQREIINYLMLFLAQKNGQKALVPNERVEWSRKIHEKSAEYKTMMENIDFTIVDGDSHCKVCAKVASAKHPLETSDFVDGIRLAVTDPTGVHQVVTCTCGAAFDVVTREGKTKAWRIPKKKALKQAVFHVLIQHGGELVPAV